MYFVECVKVINYIKLLNSVTILNVNWLLTFVLKVAAPNGQPAPKFQIVAWPPAQQYIGS